jgi:uncharacterized membrane protein YeaQ/YmgE (transglycosylase-associated protein family)
VNIRHILTTIVAAVVVWLITSFVFYWFPSNLALTLVLSIVGATIASLFVKEFRPLTGTGPLLIYSLVGSFILLLALSFYPTGQKEIQINCSVQPPTALPDPAGAYPDWKVYWKESNNMDFEIEFKEKNPNKSPFRQLLFFSKMKVNSRNGKTPGDKAVRSGNFEYGITCKNKNHVDPMLNVPPGY